jgi:hypothetical protein
MSGVAVFLRAQCRVRDCSACYAIANPEIAAVSLDFCADRIVSARLFEHSEAAQQPAAAPKSHQNDGVQIQNGYRACGHLT